MWILMQIFLYIQSYAFNLNNDNSYVYKKNYKYDQIQIIHI